MTVDLTPDISTSPWLIQKFILNKLEYGFDIFLAHVEPNH